MIFSIRLRNFRKKNKIIKGHAGLLLFYYDFIYEKEARIAFAWVPVRDDRYRIGSDSQMSCRSLWERKYILLSSVAVVYVVYCPYLYCCDLSKALSIF